MRRKNQQVSEEETRNMLHRATSGVLALEGDEGYPYAVPMSYVYHDGKLYFHSAMQGHKAEAVLKGGKASFCVILRDDVIPSRFTTHYESVIAFGRVRAVTDAQEKMAAITALAERFGKPHMEAGRKEIRDSWDHLLVIALDIEHMTGKISRELAQSKACIQRKNMV